MNIEQLDDEALLAECLSLSKHIEQCKADRIELLGEIDRRKSYTRKACTSTRDYCETELGQNRARAKEQVIIAQLSRRVRRVLRYLVAPPERRIEPAGLVALAPYLTSENADDLLTRSAGRTKPQIEALIGSYTADRTRQESERDSRRESTQPLESEPGTICFPADAEVRTDLEKARDMLGGESSDVSSTVGWALKTAIEATENRDAIEEPTASMPPTNVLRDADSDRSPDHVRGGRRVCRTTSDSATSPDHLGVTAGSAPVPPPSPATAAQTDTASLDRLGEISQSDSGEINPGNPGHLVAKRTPRSPPRDHRDRPLDSGSSG